MTQAQKLFWTLNRQTNESMRDFIWRIWREANPTLPERQPDMWTVPQGAYALEVVRDSYRSPYRFGAVLREMVCSTNIATADDPGIYSATHVHGNGSSHTIYYTYGQMVRSGSHAGPQIAAFYDPHARSAQEKGVYVEVYDASATDHA